MGASFSSLTTVEAEAGAGAGAGLGDGVTEEVVGQSSLFLNTSYFDSPAPP